MFLFLEQGGLAVDQPIPTPVPSPSPGPLVPVSDGAAAWFVALVVLAIGLLWAVPLLIDVFLTHRRHTRQYTPLVERLIKASTSGGSTLSLGELRTLAGILERPPRGTQGLTRSLLALLIVSLVGLALAALIVSDSTDSGDLRKTTMTSLLTVFATVAGFYFGSRTAQSSADQAKTEPQPGPSEPPTPPILPMVDKIDPSSGPAGTRVTITGRGLTGATQVTFGSTPGTDVQVDSDSQVTVTAPAGSGSVPVSVVTPTGTSAPSAAARFDHGGGASPVDSGERS